MALTLAQFKAIAKEPMPKKWGWDIYYWPRWDMIVVGDDYSLVELLDNPRFFTRHWKGVRRPKTLVKVGEL